MLRIRILRDPILILYSIQYKIQHSKILYSSLEERKEFFNFCVLLEGSITNFLMPGAKLQSNVSK